MTKPTLANVAFKTNEMSEEIEAHIGGLIDSDINAGCMGPTVTVKGLDLLKIAVEISTIPTGYTVTIKFDEGTKTYFPYLEKNL